MENWKIGKHTQTVVTDTCDGLQEHTGHGGDEAFEYYGGYLVCESVWRKKDASLISAAPDMFEALNDLENDDNTIPKPIWDKVQRAIKKAAGGDVVRCSQTEALKVSVLRTGALKTYIVFCIKENQVPRQENVDSILKIGTVTGLNALIDTMEQFV